VFVVETYFLKMMSDVKTHRILSKRFNIARQGDGPAVMPYSYG
jgi:hypothetical protein